MYMYDKVEKWAFRIALTVFTVGSIMLSYHYVDKHNLTSGWDRPIHLLTPPILGGNHGGTR